MMYAIHIKCIAYNTMYLVRSIVRKHKNMTKKFDANFQLTPSIET